jgi:hypothetical protein
METILEEEKADSIGRSDKYRLRINKLEGELSESQEKCEDIQKRFDDLKKDLTMVEGINATQRQELTEKNASNMDTNELSREITVLKKRMDQKTEEMEELKDKNLELRLTLKEKARELKRQEDREEQLVTEINNLNSKNKELEDKFTSEKVEGNNHFGLSRIDFMGAGGNSLAKKTPAPSSGFKTDRSKPSSGDRSSSGGHRGKWSINSNDISKNTSLIADIGTLKISEASCRLESSDFKDSNFKSKDEFETGLVMNL